MDISKLFTADPADKLLAFENLNLHKSSDGILRDLDKIWVGESSSIDELRKCLEPGYRYVLRKTIPIKEDFKVGNNLGSPGTYGCVKSCIEKSTGTQYAVKEIKKWKFKDGELTSSFFNDLRSETRLMKEVIDHPSIIEIKCVYETIDMLYIVMTACNGGELFEQIQADDGFSERKASKLFADMLSAIFYIHSKGIMHCDLKPENFIFMNKASKSNKEEVGIIKLIDFGMAKVVRWRKYYKKMNGTPYYIAPEVLEGKYNKSCDMWSMGVILFILVFGFPPFFEDKKSKDKATTYKNIYSKIKKGFNPKVKAGYGA